MPSLDLDRNGEMVHEVMSGVWLIMKNEIKTELKHEVLSELGGSSARCNGKPNGIDDSVRLHVRPPPTVFTPICHPLVEEATREVDGYYLKHWGFPDEKARKKFVAAGFSRVTCLYFPKALDDRIAYACSLLTILFLIDGKYLDFLTGSSASSIIMIFRTNTNGQISLKTCL